MKTEHVLICAGCLISSGGIEEGLLIDFRGHALCSWCVWRWPNEEKLYKRRISFDEYTQGIKSAETSPSAQEKRRLRDVEILKQYQAGKSRAQLMMDYHLSRTTINTIFRHVK